MQIKILENNKREELEQDYKDFGEKNQIHFTQSHYAIVNGISFWSFVVFYTEGELKWR